MTVDSEEAGQHQSNTGKTAVLRTGPPFASLEQKRGV